MFKNLNTRDTQHAAYNRIPEHILSSSNMPALFRFFIFKIPKIEATTELSLWIFNFFLNFYFNDVSIL